jgi:Transposase
MESTGVYWIPAYEVLEQRGFEVVLVNARDAKHVPGRKTDVSDAQWLRRLHEYGLLRGSFHPQGNQLRKKCYDYRSSETPGTGGRCRLRRHWDVPGLCRGAALIALI